MTTSPHPGTTYRNAEGHPVTLANELGRGGEGAVFTLSGRAGVAKIWLKPEAARADKLAAMIAMSRPGLLTYCAWPEETLRDAHGRVVGFVMAKLDALPLHQLITPYHRKRLFVGRDWRFIVHVAGNLATAIENIHDAGAVVGDVNENGFRVTSDGMVRVLDCDSFQVSAHGTVYRCAVGVADFTPPELQGVPGGFAAVDRKPDHDRFGLAILLFKMLMMGRHPYAGQILGKDDGGEHTLAERIGHHAFAYGPRAAALRIAPPPGALGLADLDPAVADLFVAAFAMDAPKRGRPPAATWRTALAGMERRLVACDREALHWLVTGNDCPWCRLESAMAVDFFSLTVPPPPPPPLPDILKPVPAVMQPMVARTWANVAGPVQAARRAWPFRRIVTLILAPVTTWLLVPAARELHSAAWIEALVTLVMLALIALGLWLVAFPTQVGWLAGRALRIGVVFKYLPGLRWLLLLGFAVLAYITLRNALPHMTGWVPVAPPDPAK